MPQTDPIFVFGSNLAGRHGKGAALFAKKHFGAIQGQGDGPQGHSYAIPTKNKDLRPLALPYIQACVGIFIEYAEAYPEKQFFVTRIGCGLAGYTDTDIAPMFVEAPPNCRLPDGWRELGRQAVEAV